VRRSLGLPPTPENREAAGRLADIVSAYLRAGRSLEQIDAALDKAATVNQAPASRPLSLRGYYEKWIRQVEITRTRPTAVEDYRKHIEGYVLPILGDLEFAALRHGDLRDLQADLLSRGLSVRYVRNILASSLRSMVTDAIADEALTRDPYRSRFRWPDRPPTEPDPFPAHERDAVIQWFESHRFRHKIAGGKYEKRIYPPYAAFVDLLFWSGLRPSEATGLTQGDLDLANGRVFVRRSRHKGRVSSPKTRNARRTVELFPRLVRRLESMRLLHVAPDDPVFVNLEGRPLDQQNFTRHWYECLRSLNFRVRGIYCTKDTFVTTAMAQGCNVRWLEAQCGEDYATLRRHYGAWVSPEIGSELRRFNQADPSLFGVVGPSNRNQGARGSANS
jgi:integrase